MILYNKLNNMIQVILLTILFSFSTVVSILLLGDRTLLSGAMTPLRIFQILLTWQFILGALFAFASRLLFLLINSALYKIPEVSNVSTTVTTLITTIALIFVIIANYIFLHERINFTQGIGAIIIIFGIFLITK